MVVERGAGKTANLTGVDINNFCYVDLTPAGVRAYEQHYRGLSEGVSAICPEWADFLKANPLKPAPLKITRQGIKFQIWDLMFIFGPALYEGFTEPPFRSVRLDLSSTFARQERRSRTRRTIDVEDRVLVKLTKDGNDKLKQAFIVNPPFRTARSLTEIPFSTLSHVFGEDVCNGSWTNPIRGLLIYIPEPVGNKNN